MKRRHHTPEQIIRLLAEGEKLLGQEASRPLVRESDSSGNAVRDVA